MTAPGDWADAIRTRGDITVFRRAALELCARVPRGRVTTYQRLAVAVAAATGAPKPSARAAGSAMKHNPYAPVVPCHRIVASDLKLGGFSGSTDPDGPNLHRKADLLRSEGVAVESTGSKVAHEAVYDFSDKDIREARSAADAHRAFLGSAAPVRTKRDRSAAPSSGRAVRARGAASASSSSSRRAAKDLSTPAGVRAACARGELAGPTAGMCPGAAQANLVIVPEAHADDFERFCALNPKPCPLLERLPAGDPRSRTMAPGSDVTKDLPRYRVWRSGELAEEPADAGAAWAEMTAPVAFLLGCSFSFEEAMLAAGLPVRHIEEGRNVPMFATSVQTKRAGPFSGPMVVSMRPMTRDQAERAREVTSRFSRVHGSPVHVGSPADIGVTDLRKPDFGDAVSVRGGEVPVFWACGVTPQLALQRAKLPLAITHSPGHMLVLDARNEALADEAAAGGPE